MNFISTKQIVNLSHYLLGLTTTISLLNPLQAKAFNINFDYTYDTNNFFDPTTTAGLDRRNTLTQAGSYFTNHINDNLSAISQGSGIAEVGGDNGAGGTNTWTASFFNPATGSRENIVDLTVTEDTITIYAGGRELNGLGRGGTGSFSTASGSQDFLDSIRARGQAGALTNPKTDIGLWGGSLTFDTDIVINVDDGMGNTTPTSFDWHNTTDTAGLDSNEYDFMSVAIHEIAHVLGFSSTEGSSWENQINNAGTGFIGANALAAYQAETDPNAEFIPIQSGSLSHWNNGTESITLGGVRQEAALDPSITNGRRKLMTNLDYAGLEDIGWEVEANVVPFEFSPALGIFLSCGFFGSLSLKNRWQKKSNKLKLGSIKIKIGVDR